MAAQGKKHPREPSDGGDEGLFLGHHRSPLPVHSVFLVLGVMPILLWSINWVLMSGDGWQSAAVSGNTRSTFTAAAPVEQIISPAGGQISVPAPPPPGEWISIETEINLTSTLLSRWRAGGGEACRDAGTTDISIPALDGAGDGTVLELHAGPVHEYVIVSLYDGGGRRCLGGDYFEADLSGGRWKARTPVTDHGDGSNSMRLQLHPDFAGEYKLTVVRLFCGFEGLRFSTERFVLRRELRKIPLRFRRAAAVSSPPPLRRCRAGDFT